MVLEQIFTNESVVMDVQSSDKDALFEELVRFVCAQDSSLNGEEALAGLRDRESKMSTGIMHSVAIPHAVCTSLKNTRGVIGISRKGIDYQSLDGSPVHIVFMLLVASTEIEHHLQIMKQLAFALQTPDFIDKILKCKTSTEVIDLLCKTEEGVN